MFDFSKKFMISLVVFRAKENEMIWQIMNLAYLLQKCLQTLFTIM